MTILFHLDEGGGFTAGNTETGLTAYAYPTSFNARMAKRKPEIVAYEMLEGEREWDRQFRELVQRDAERLAKLRRVGRTA